MTSKPFKAAIVAMTRDNVIGLNNDLPWHYSEDLKRFKRQTIDTTIIMGRNTWESIGSKPLPRRRNIVITRSTLDIEHYASIDQALENCANEKVWFIGGGQIYLSAFDYLDLLDVTYVPDNIEDASAIKFPPIDDHVWKIKSQNPLDSDDRLINVIYERREQ